jgi:hypothetical protein
MRYITLMSAVVHIRLPSPAAAPGATYYYLEAVEID